MTGNNPSEFRSRKAFLDLARALCGRPGRDSLGRLVFPQPSLHALARKLRVPGFRIRRWAADLHKVPPRIQMRIVRLLGQTPPEPKWRRDRWLIAHGLPMPSGERRTYLVHTWAPRFRCRLVDLSEDPHRVSAGQGQADLLSGVFYDRAGAAAIEFEWLDPVPSERRLQQLVLDIIDALAAHRRAALVMSAASKPVRSHPEPGLNQRPQGTRP